LYPGFPSPFVVVVPPTATGFGFGGLPTGVEPLYPGFPSPFEPVAGVVVVVVPPPVAGTAAPPTAGAMPVAGCVAGFVVVVVLPDDVVPCVGVLTPECVG
jgi:hypothetical protein